MFRHRLANTAVLTLALATLATLAACSKPAIKSNFITVSARLSGSNEVPAVAGKGGGELDASLSPRTMVLAWAIHYTDLSGPVTAAHFHGPALAGESAGIALPLAGAMRTPITGSAVLTADQAAEMSEGKWYINLHTAAHPGGEIRGQVSVRR